MHDRRDEYGRCARAFVADRERDGASGIFDTALTNGLAAIVAARWPGEVTAEQGFVKSANGLLAVVEANADAGANGIYELEDADPLPQIDGFGDPLQPMPTRIDVALLREGILRTQVIRHAREDEAEPLEERHINALAALNDNAAYVARSNTSRMPTNTRSGSLSRTRSSAPELARTSISSRSTSGHGEPKPTTRRSTSKSTMASVTTHLTSARSAGWRR
jgi:hypothetical protein